MPMFYKCSVCGKERRVEDKRILKLEYTDGKPAMRAIETCVFCSFKTIPEGKLDETQSKPAISKESNVKADCNRK